VELKLPSQEGASFGDPCNSEKNWKEAFDTSKNDNPEKNYIS
jgi:hypothetical protein